VLVRGGLAALSACGASPSSPGPGGDAPTAAGINWAAWPLFDPQSFDASSPDVVLDRTTQLAWRRHTDRAVTWAEAKDACDALALGGQDDWRLPTRLELQSIMRMSDEGPMISTAAFDEAVDLRGADLTAWSASLVAGSPDQRWAARFDVGYLDPTDLTFLGRARCVRDTIVRPPLEPHYAVAADTVKDLGTGLTWQRAVGPESSYASAVTYCQGLALDGGGWRLPRLRELRSLVNEAAQTPAIDATAFPGTPPRAGLWSSNAVGSDLAASSQGGRWSVSFTKGVSAPFVSAAYVRCVRGGGLAPGTCTGDFDCTAPQVCRNDLCVPPPP
jgi:hypothetical protein